MQLRRKRFARIYALYTFAEEIFYFTAVRLGRARAYEREAMCTHGSALVFSALRPFSDPSPSLDDFNLIINPALCCRLPSVIEVFKHYKIDEVVVSYGKTICFQ